MRGKVALAILLLAPTAPASAQSTEAPPTAEQMIETAREAYSVSQPEPEPEPCPEATTDEIVVCQQYQDLGDNLRVASPTERARAAGVMPPDPIPNAPDVAGPGIFRGKGITMGEDPPPIYIIDLAAIPEALTPEEAALVFRAEDRPQATTTPEAASPAAAP